MGWSSVLETAGPRAHVLQFYGKDDRFFVRNVCRYLAEGLKRREGLVVVATPAHADAFLLHLTNADSSVSHATVGYGSLVGPFIVSGIGMGMFFAPVANVVLSAVKPVEEGKASGANNAIREVGGVFGVAVLASLFTRYGGYESPETFNDGLVPALWVGAAVVAGGALLALFIPPKKRVAEAGSPELVAHPEAA